jgi:hypothetical protein
MKNKYLFVSRHKTSIVNVDGDGERETGEEGASSGKGERKGDYSGKSLVF